MAVNPIVGLSPEILLVAVGALLPLLGAFNVSNRVLAAMSVVTVALAGYLTLGFILDLPGLAYLQTALAESAAPGQPGVAHFFVLWQVDAFAVFFKAVFLLVSGLVVLGSMNAAPRRNPGEYYALILLATVGMMAVASSRDLITLFVGLELASFSTMALAGYYKGEEASTEASVKYFIVGALSSAIALYGISLVYGLSGSVTFDGVAFHFQSLVSQGAGISPMVIFAWVFIFAGFAFKITAVPFHVYAPDVYQGAPTPIAALLAAGSKKMGFAALFKIFLVGFIALKTNWAAMVGVIAVLTMTVGNVAALRQDDVKRMLAYSSVAHAGYILIGLVVATQLAVAGSLFHSLTHAVMTTGAFLALAAVALLGVGSYMDDWRGLGRRAPVMAFSMAVFMVSFAGLPPLAGFASKFVLFASAISAGGWFIWLAIAGIINSAISLYYYARVIRTMYADEPVSTERVQVPTAVTASVLVALVATVLLGVWPGPVIDAASQAATIIIP